MMVLALIVLAAAEPEMITIISSSEQGNLDTVKHIVEAAEQSGGDMLSETLKSKNEWNMYEREMHLLIIPNNHCV
jgi:hypothetical protein